MENRVEFCCHTKMSKLQGINNVDEYIDDYNLINSRTISDYCRSIKHHFNTEELAVLIYRNHRMGIEEKIEKYNDLIENYPDMEVIERINCKHYDSVKTMIENEIRRLNTLYKNLIQENDDCIYVWNECNKIYRSDLNHIFKNYDDTYNNAQKYIEEWNGIVSFKITKKYFNQKKNNIYAEFVVKNGKTKLINLVEENVYAWDINQIFLNIPTPFEKGDILISNDPLNTLKKDENIFVLNYLCTWEKDLDDLLSDGNHDPSDMIGFGYFLDGENSTNIMDFDIDNYDSFEYYEGSLEGEKRILKSISSLLKEKISLELFIHAYDYIKADSKKNFLSSYTDKELKLAGFKDPYEFNCYLEDSEQIYNMPPKKREEFEELVMHASTNYEILKNLNGKDLKDVRDTAYFKAHTGGKPAEAKILYSKLQKKCDEILKQMRKI